MSALLVGCSDGETNSKEKDNGDSKDTVKGDSIVGKIISINEATDLAINFEKDFAKATTKGDFSIIEDYFMTEDDPDYEKIYWQIPSEEQEGYKISDMYSGDVRAHYYMSYAGLETIGEQLEVEIEDVSLNEVMEYDDGYSVALNVSYIVNGRPKTDVSTHYIYVDENKKGYIMSPHDFVTTYTPPLEDWMVTSIINDYNMAIREGRIDGIAGVAVKDSEYYQEGIKAIEKGEFIEPLSYYCVSTIELSATEYKAVVIEFTPEGNKRFVEYVITRVDDNFYPMGKKRTVIKEIPFDKLSEYDKNIVKKDQEEAEKQAGYQAELEGEQQYDQESNYDTTDEIPYDDLSRALENYLTAYTEKDVDSLSYFVDSQSNIYKEQYKYMQSLEDRNVLVTLWDYSILDTRENEDGSYMLEVSEKYTIEAPGKEDKDVEQYARYTFNNINGELLITNIVIE